MAQRQDRRSGPPVAAAELEHVSTVGKLCVEVADKRLGGIAFDLPRCVPRGDRVVAAPYDLALVQSRSTTPASAMPKPMHIVAMP
jgi:hypothetical protein